MKKCIITIGRQCGSGGHTIGKTVAERLDIPFYDKKLTQAVAERSGLSAEAVEAQGESHSPSLLYNIATNGYTNFSASQHSMSAWQGPGLPDQIQAYQTELIRELAEKGACVIVGRCADYILRERNDCLHIFISGAARDRMERAVLEHGISPAAAESYIRNQDKKRANYYKYMTDRTWGAAANYDLCLNSSKLGIERCVDIITGFAKE